MDRTFPPVQYSEYLRLDKILSSQYPKSAEYGKPAHDETLFIIVHQVYELWFKQILHELDSILTMFRSESIDEKNIGLVVSRLNRIQEIQRLLIGEIDVLETMTPLDFLDFRNYLVPASGFQSFQFRMIEIRWGLRPEQRIEFDQKAYYQRFPEEEQVRLKQAEREPSLFDLVERWLERTPFLQFHGFDFFESYRQTVFHMLASDEQIIRSNPVLTEEEKNKQLKILDSTRENFVTLFDETKHAEAVRSGRCRLSCRASLAVLFIYLYRDQPILHLPYKLLENLVTIDEGFSIWRYRHALMVLRMIGSKIGTGGSAGHHYLKQTAEQYKVYNDCFNLTTFLIPRSDLPELPQDLQTVLGFSYSAKEK